MREGKMGERKRGRNKDVRENDPQATNPRAGDVVLPGRQAERWRQWSEENRQARPELSEGVCSIAGNELAGNELAAIVSLGTSYQHFG